MNILAYRKFGRKSIHAPLCFQFGLHPLSDARRPDYEAWLAQGGAQ